ncbi:MULTISPECIES: MarR family winged helix-turn-helix transcriptional regulator [Chromobacterium]|uniref:MarR family winged helix-turn-helix transcriptional regulator n=1 Tax=Chromobacterium TaxID=535 RepID=UPI0005B87BDC|nr:MULTISPECIES: MarR family transcriptional regulator [Chromobacterium]QOZ85041.1 MarR family transcriptional regulator [Chromobacterium sp. Rain0013]WON85254.1 MarR family transcriptional regulator [Chromobacterium haemolyticum]
MSDAAATSFPPSDASAATRALEPAIAPHLQLLTHSAGEEVSQTHAGLGLLLLWLSDDVLGAVNADLRSLDVTESKLNVLMLFSLQERGWWRNGPLTPSAIADYLGVTRSTVTGQLDWLERRGLLQRQLRDEDRRSLELSLTEAGRELLRQALPGFWRACQRLTEALDESECAALWSLLAKVWSRLKAD